ncbi:MAG TPA: hypothetical protein VII43_05180 [Opitutaceae bacterium]
MADERKAFLLRADPLLWKDIESWAADELRSVNGQIEFLLREAVRRRKKSGPPGSETEAPTPAEGQDAPPAPG